MAPKTTTELLEETLEWFENWEKNPRLSQILTGTRLALLSALVVVGVSGKPQEAQAQEVYTTEHAVFRVDYSASDTLTDEDIAKIEAGVARFNEELSLLPDDTQIAHQLIGTLIEGFDTFQRQRLIGLYNAGMTVQEAVEQVYFSSLPRTPDTVRVMHAQAITIGLRDLELHLKQDPELSDMSEQDYHDYAAELMDTFLAGQEAWVIEDLVKYAPAFSEYVVQFPSDFILSEGVNSVLNTIQSEANIAESEANIAESEANIAESEANIAESEANIAESEANIAESEARTVELREINEALESLIRTLQANS